MSQFANDPSKGPLFHRKFLPWTHRWVAMAHNGAVGTLPTLGDVAAKAGVSTSTASRALSGRGAVAEATRLRVAAAALDLGYVPDANASRLVTGRSQAVGLIVPNTGSWYFDEVLRGVQTTMLAGRIDVVLYSARPETEDRQLVFDYFVGRKRLDGIIAVGIEPSAHELERLIQLGLPLVTVGSWSDDTTAVTIDDEAAARIATEHLLQLGHTRIAFLGGDPDGRAFSFGDTRRYEGYAKAMDSAGLGDQVRRGHSEVAMHAGHDAAVALLGDKEQRPTAIVAVADEVAAGAILACSRLGLRVPDDVSIVGVDDHPCAQLFNLTTVAQHPADQGQQAAELLLRHLEEPHFPSTKVTDPIGLIIRASTGPASDQFG